MNEDLARLAGLLGGRRVVVLSGAGCSTESGIPDYRGPSGSLRRRHPVRYQEFIADAERRRRYWARSAVGWPTFAEARPNAAHLALAALEEAGAVCGVVTQNVDELHQRAGSRAVVELHGSLFRVACLACGARSSRHDVQAELLALNPQCAGWGAELAPDGDAELEAAQLEGFLLPGCRACGGVLKPDVVFFGENVPSATVEAAWRSVNEAEALLVVGSSLHVFSGYRFVRGAAERGVPVAVVNLGATRADALASVRLEARAGEVLPRLAAQLYKSVPLKMALAAAK